MDENAIKDDAVAESEVAPAEREDLEDDTLEGASGGQWGGAEISGKEQVVARKPAWQRWG